LESDIDVVSEKDGESVTVLDTDMVGDRDIDSVWVTDIDWVGDLVAVTSSVKDSVMDMDVLGVKPDLVIVSEPLSENENDVDFEADNSCVKLFDVDFDRVVVLERESVGVRLMVFRVRDIVRDLLLDGSSEAVRDRDNVTDVDKLIVWDLVNVIVFDFDAVLLSLMDTVFVAEGSSVSEKVVERDNVEVMVDDMDFDKEISSVSERVGEPKVSVNDISWVMDLLIVGVGGGVIVGVTVNDCERLGSSEKDFVGVGVGGGVIVTDLVMEMVSVLVFIFVMVGVNPESDAESSSVGESVLDKVIVAYVLEAETSSDSELE
jgi:hypothetical protein